MVHITGFCGIDRGKIIKIKVMIIESRTSNLCFAGGVQFSKYLVIFLKSVIRISNQVFTFCIYFIIIGISTIIATKFLVDPAYDDSITFQTLFLIHDLILKKQDTNYPFSNDYIQK